MTHAKPSTCMESLGQLAPVSFWRLRSLLDPWTHHLQCDNHTCYMPTHLNVTLSSTANEDCQLHVLRTNIRRVHDQKYLSNNWIYCGIRSCKRPDHKKMHSLIPFTSHDFSLEQISFDSDLPRSNSILVLFSLMKDTGANTETSQIDMSSVIYVYGTHGQRSKTSSNPDNKPHSYFCKHMQVKDDRNKPNNLFKSI